MDTYQDNPARPSGERLAVAAGTSEAEVLAAQAEAAAAERRRIADDVGGAMRAGLLRWLALLTAGAAACVLTGHPDTGLFLAIAGMFALAGSWDTRDRARTGDPMSDSALAPGGLGSMLRMLVPLVVPVSGALLYAGIGMFARTPPTTAAHIAAGQWCAAAAAVCLLMAFPPITQLVANAFMRREPPGFTTRLTASIAVVVLLLPVPARLLMDSFMGYLRESGKPLAEPGALVGQLVGEVLFALAAVRLWVGRDLRAVAGRLGLGPLGPRNLAVAALGLAAVMGVNAGMEWLELHQFPALWAADQEMGRMIAGKITIGTALVLGVSAGVGEELLVRGALQPRIGLLWASLLFAAGHVQYTWFGMITIVLLGLTLGVVKTRANTSTAIVVHVLYDIIAALGAR
jgi:membrane protease YdiL (CAAX protease family)